MRMRRGLGLALLLIMVLGTAQQAQAFLMEPFSPEAIRKNIKIEKRFYPTREDGPWKKRASSSARPTVILYVSGYGTQQPPELEGVIDRLREALAKKGSFTVATAEDTHTFVGRDRSGPEWESYLSRSVEPGNREWLEMRTILYDALSTYDVEVDAYISNMWFHVTVASAVDAQRYKRITFQKVIDNKRVDAIGFSPGFIDGLTVTVGDLLTPAH